MLEGRSVLEELIPTVSGMEYWTGRVLSIYGKLCFFLLVLCELKDFASASVLSPCCLGCFPHTIGLCQSQGQASHQI